ncbi:MAG: hypothetical protein GX591_18475 [Planctomycetes bacterium]|nr:hypothetical protein [Planctomycetota bacterium]
MNSTYKRLATAVAFSVVCAAAPALGAGSAATIAPFLDDQAFAVVRVDIGGIGVPALAQWLGSMTGGPQERLAESAAQVTAWQKNLLSAGAREAYVVLSLADLPDNPPRIIVPVPGGAKAEAIAAAIRRPIDPADEPEGGPFGEEGVVVVHGNVVIVAESQATADRVRQVVPSPRPDLEAALAAAGKAPIQAVLVPSDAQRRIVAETLPALPAPLPPLTGEQLSRAVRWAAVGIELPPAGSLQLVVQSPDAESAATLKETVDAALATGAAILQSQEVLPNAQEIAKRLSPAVRGDRMVLAIDRPAFKSLVDDLVTPALIQASRTTQATLAMVRVRGITTAMAMYRMEHNNEWPPNLQALIDEGLMDARQLNEPSTDRPAMVYIRPPADAGDNVVVVYEDPASHDRRETAVGFVGTQVLSMPDDATFRAMIEKAKRDSAQAYGGAAE